MRQRVEYFSTVLLVLIFIGITVGLFIPGSPLLPLYAFYLFAVLGLQMKGKGPIAFMMTGFTTIFGVFCMSSVPSSEIMIIPVLILVLWGSVFLLHLHQESIEGRFHLSQMEEEELLKKSRVLRSEIAYYEKRRGELGRRAEQRRQLAQTARELGGLLDPQQIQSNLIEKARSLFPERAVRLSYGQTSDSVDRIVIQRKQPLLVPSDLHKGPPLIAAPVTAQRSVAGVLKVGGYPGQPFSRDDLRLLEILASLASLALDNSLLFSQVQESALRDSLTGLLTHRAFQDQLEAAILESSRYNTPVSIILTDVDHFKSINDRYGHQAGDQILQGFAHILARHVRDIDLVARYGGEEFVLILYQTGLEDAIACAEKIRSDLEMQPFETGAGTIDVTGSFGVATFPDDATTAPQLVRTADQRLYAAKDAGRNRVIGRAA